MTFLYPSPLLLLELPITILQVMSGCALAGGVRGIHVLKLLKALSPILEPNLVEMWDTVIPKLVQYLEGNKNSSTRFKLCTRIDLLV